MRSSRPRQIRAKQYVREKKTGALDICDMTLTLQVFASERALFVRWREVLTVLLITPRRTVTVLPDCLHTCNARSNAREVSAPYFVRDELVRS